MRRTTILLSATTALVTMAGPAAPSRAHAQSVSDTTATPTPPAPSTVMRKVARTASASPATDGDKDEQVIVTGTRDPHQTARSSVSPIQVVTAAQLAATGQADVRDALIQLAPSVARSIRVNGSANMTDAISLRGLTPNQTLVLVNGKRRHTTAVLSNNAGPQQGATPVDIDMIPVSAVDHIEILQDGAAAQYGSDAIAGVVNIILKHDTHGLEAQSLNGGRYAGDGFTSGESLNWGTSLAGRGFFDLNAEYKYQDHTFRATPDSRTGRNDFMDIGDPRQQRETIGYNMEYAITDDVKLYSFATYGHRNGESYQDYRVPTASLPMYPYGFSPQETLDENDYSVTVGFKGRKFNWDWDLSTTYGGDSERMGLFDSINTAMLQNFGSSPTRFHLMSFSNTQWTTDAGVRRAFDVPLLAAPLNLALGAQYRYDSYHIGAGDMGSYYGTGASAFHGLSPNNASDSNRDVTAGYIDVSTQLLPKWQVDLAGRFEHYTDAGDTETGKVSSRYDVNRYFGLRGTVASGFRAPTLAEEHWSNMSVAATTATGYIPVDSAGARLLGAKPLKPERSTSFSAGFVVNPIDNLHVTVDAYQIDLRDRIMAAGVYNGASAIEALALNGFAIPAGVTANAVTAQYYANAASTRTRGLDITANYLTRLGRYGRINWDVAANFNQTTIRHVAEDGNGNSLLNAQQEAYLTSYTPRNRVIFGGVWHYGDLDFTVHEIRYGHATSQLEYYTGPLAYSNTQFMRFLNPPRYETNLVIGYQVSPRWHVALGANNVGNARQKKIPEQFRYLGAYAYDVNIEQIGYNGGFYYFQVNFKL
ncbi:TonB-dependent receptor plug domain-containing protein [Gluconacetobacter diazotrophicus]|uniref:Putative TonB-dependent receptor n=1 Tax=Gluconacetobacter diazotrophicus (strain ATCC 49037 / DSM 5601 / CCUG 37298 / CIP 103539 / LMG 7603 / PAl5) TaxID=272568 RepID=A9H5Q3_GLUDA|nr:TonB-dependent receptor [Gluconacetobacter diazotrophicus]CAP54362.1 putative TonB-dependent receptor [Gluconacetobacter diazotrophicus PA1 5]